VPLGAICAKIWRLCALHGLDEGSATQGTCQAVGPNLGLCLRLETDPKNQTNCLVGVLFVFVFVTKGSTQTFSWVTEIGGKFWSLGARLGRHCWFHLGQARLDMLPREQLNMKNRRQGASAAELGAVPGTAGATSRPRGARRQKKPPNKKHLNFFVCARCLWVAAHLARRRPAQHHIISSTTSCARKQCQNARQGPRQLACAGHMCINRSICGSAPFLFGNMSDIASQCLHECTAVPVVVHRFAWKNVQ
jgi:hypothetical protein